jgi:Ser/Thr protein kinase RdoA (MazF antagonist)
MSLSVGKMPAGPPVSLRNRSFEEMKRAVAEGEFLHALQVFFQERGETLAGVTLAEEKYEEESLFLVLLLEFGGGGRIVSPREWVFQYLLDDDLFGAGPIRFWSYPEDPELPVLARLHSSPGFFQETAWEGCAGEIFPEDGDFCMQRLLYNPGRRATFLVVSERTGKKFILKAVRPKEWRVSLEKLEWMDRAGLHKTILFPRIVAYSSRDHLFLYDYLPGGRIDRLGPERREELKSGIYEEVAALLTGLHQTTLPGLPRWSPYKEIGALSALTDLLEIRAPGVAAVVQPMVEAIADDLIRRNQVNTQPIHHSFSAKHLLYYPDRGRGRQLAVLDWDSAVLGPQEKDLASFLASFSKGQGEALFFIEQYRRKRISELDLKLIHRFIQARRLTKICRRFLRGDFSAERNARGLRELDLLANEKARLGA